MTDNLNNASKYRQMLVIWAMTFYTLICHSNTRIQYKLLSVWLHSVNYKV